ncbi:hypothetical protein Tco_1536985, partial [Tanacetum coccineum]
TRFERLSKQSNDPPLSRVNTLRSGEDRMKLQELMEMRTKLSDKVLDLENVKDAQALIECSAEKSLGDAETQGRYGHDIEVNTASTSITTTIINITTVEPVTTASAPITTAGASVSAVEPSTPPTTTILIEDEDLTITQTFMKMRNKGKGIMQEPKKPVKVKGKDHIEADEEVARRLEAQLQAEFKEDERVAR